MTLYVKYAKKFFIFLIFLCGCDASREFLLKPTNFKVIESNFSSKLFVKVKGLKSKLFRETIREELESPEFFEELSFLSPKEGIQPHFSTLIIQIRNREEHHFGRGLRWLLGEQKGFGIRYEGFLELTDSNGDIQYSHDTVGIALDVKSKEARDVRFHESTLAGDLDEAARRNFFTVLTSKLHDFSDGRARRKIEDIQTLKLASGVGPIRVGLVSFDLKNSRLHRSVPMVEGYLQTAFSPAKSEFQLLPYSLIKQALERTTLGQIHGLFVNREQCKELKRVLSVNYVLLGKLRLEGMKTIVDLVLLDLEKNGQKIFEVSGLGEGISSLRMSCIDAVKKLLKEVPKSKIFQRAQATKSSG